MRVIVLGTLGDLVKKIVELEVAELSSRTSAVRISTYYEVLKQWPVTDRPRVDLLAVQFKFCMLRFKSAEERIESDLTDNGVNTVRSLKEYFLAKKTMRKIIADINSLSVPLLDPMEIEVP